MKKIFLLTLAAAISFTSFSQVKWGAQVIGNLSSGTITGFEDDEEEFLKNKSIFGLGAGVIAEVPLATDVTFRPSLNFLQKGMAFDLNYSDPIFGSEEIRFKTNLFYAELPLNFAYNGNLKFGKYFIGMGPSFGFGLSGKAKITSTFQYPGMPTETETESADAFGSEDDDGLGLKRFEISANFIGGVQWNNGFFVNAGYLLGLNNLAPSGEDGSYKHKGLQLTVGMFFNKK